jgi:hypothetical protein
VVTQFGQVEPADIDQATVSHIVAHDAHLASLRGADLMGVGRRIRDTVHRSAIMVIT